jgi:hypothetical protein
MAQPKWLNKYLTMKPEVTKIFNDLDTWHDHCRIELIDFNPADLYKSKSYKDWQRTQEYLQRKARREAKAKHDRFSN